MGVVMVFYLEDRLQVLILVYIGRRFRDVLFN